MSHYALRTACRVCQVPHNFAPVLHLGHQSLSGQFPGPGDPDPPTCPLHVVRCLACGLVQLEHTADRTACFDRYWYRSGVTATMRAHLGAVAAEAAAMLERRQGPVCVAPRVLDIGGNDGELLNAVPLPTGNRTLIDPSDVPLAHEGIRHVRGYFPRDILLTQKYDLVFSLACFYSTDDPDGWASAVRALLAPDGLWCLEVADLSAVLRKVAFDYFCAEHVALYSAHDIANVARRAKLKLVRVEESECNGGSIRCYLAHESCTAYDGNPEWAARRDALVAHGAALAQDGDACDRFAAQARKLANALGAAVEDERAAGRAVHLLGASTKAGAVMQFAGLTSALVEAAADRDPRKVGRRMPGTGIPVIPEDESRKKKDRTFLTTLPFRDEILARERAAGTQADIIFFPSMDRVAI